MENNLAGEELEDMEEDWKERMELIADEIKPHSQHLVEVSKLWSTNIGQRLT